MVHPTDPDVVYVAALGPSVGPEPGARPLQDDGRRPHAGRNTKFVDEDTGFVDVAMDPQSPDTLYAASYQRRRTPIGYNGGGPGSGLWKTTDGGATWKKLTKGLPEDGDVGRIGLAVYRRDPRIVYALVEHAKEGGIYRSDDRGRELAKAVGHQPAAVVLQQDPRRPEQRPARLGAGRAACTTPRTAAGPSRPTVVEKIHGDYHAFWIDPAELRPHAGRHATAAST